MSKIELPAPRFAKVQGALYDTTDIHDLTQDMLQIELPGGLFIDVGWYPQWNPSGRYMILVFRDNVDDTLERIRSRNVSFVAAKVASLIGKYSPSHEAAPHLGKQVSSLTPTKSVGDEVPTWRNIVVGQPVLDMRFCSHGHTDRMAG